KIHDFIVEGYGLMVLLYETARPFLFYLHLDLYDGTKNQRTRILPTIHPSDFRWFGYLDSSHPGRTVPFQARCLDRKPSYFYRPWIAAIFGKKSPVCSHI